MSEDLRIKSTFHNYREKYEPKVPAILKAQEIAVATSKVTCDPGIKELFPTLCKGDILAATFSEVPADKNAINKAIRIGCVLSGGQAAGGHNVIVGLYEQIKRRNPSSQLFGFLNGPIGIYTGKYREITAEDISFFKNRGGFDMIRSGRNKIETPEQFQKSAEYCTSLNIDGLVVIGGDDSNTNACLLGEYFKKNNCRTAVIGCPKTIDGDLKNDQVEVSFGFDTACKTFSEIIGNIMMDTVSTKKYYHFIRLMGRSASHITLECALLTRPNYTFIGEEVQLKKQKLSEIMTELVKMVVNRSKAGKDYGVVLLPEGLIEFIDDVGALIREINDIFGKQMADDDSPIEERFQKVLSFLSSEGQVLMKLLPKSIAFTLLNDRDSHGNVQVSKIETDALIVALLETELAKLKQSGEYKGQFNPQCHFLGYEGRCAFPTTFDCDYCYALGVNAAILIEKGFTGMMSTVRNLKQSPDHWVPGGYPLVTMMHVEQRKGKSVPVIKKYLTDLNGANFKIYESNRKIWAENDYYRSRGPIQFEMATDYPYLVEAPKNIYRDEEIKYQKNQEPYFPVNPKYNIGTLNMKVINDQVTLPTAIKDNNCQIISRHKLQFKSEELQAAVQKQYPQTFSEGASLVEVTAKGKHREGSTIVSTKSGLKFGIAFMGRQASGGHSIIEGLFNYAKSSGGSLVGFIGGNVGIVNQKYIEVTEQNFKHYSNQGGFHFLGRTNDKLRSDEELAQALKTCNELKLDGLVLVGSVQTLSDTLILSNYLLANNCKTRVVGAPCSINNNVGHHMLEMTVGFDTAVKLYSQLIGNIMIDCASAVKYWYFIRCMGQKASHLVLEAALQTQPNITLISEEIQRKGWALNDIVVHIADVVAERAANGKNFGTCIIPEGLPQFLPQCRALVQELNKAMKNIKHGSQEHADFVKKIMDDENFAGTVMTQWSAAFFKSLPDFIQKQIFGSIQNGVLNTENLETERLISYLVDQELKKRKKAGEFKGSFASLTHFFGYQGRSAMPSVFDCKLGITYGYLTGLLISGGLTGMCPTVRGLSGAVENWQLGAIPLVNMCKVNTVDGSTGIQASEVSINSKVFKQYQSQTKNWVLQDYYSNPGPTQFFGERSDDTNNTLISSNQDYSNLIQQIDQLCSEIQIDSRFGTHQDLLQLTINHLKNLKETTDTIRHKYN